MFLSARLSVGWQQDSACFYHILGRPRRGVPALPQKVEDGGLSVFRPRRRNFGGTHGNRSFPIIKFLKNEAPYILITSCRLFSRMSTHIICLIRNFIFLLSLRSSLCVLDISQTYIFADVFSQSETFHSLRFS